MPDLDAAREAAWQARIAMNPGALDWHTEHKE